MAKDSSNRDETSVVVVGLGRFGSSVSESLVRLGHEVLAIDNDPEHVQKHAHEVTHIVEADATDVDALRQIGVQNFTNAVVGIGTTVEASVLTVLALSDLGVTDIWAKALSPEHGRILERIGASHIVYPEISTGERVAHLVTGKMIDFIAFDDGFAIVKTRAPREAFDRSLDDVKLRGKYGVTVIGRKQRGQDFEYATRETIVRRGDMLIVCGQTDRVEKFASMT